MRYTMGSLFAGIGGFDLGFERAGFTTLWQVELDPYCRKVLAKHFPEAERYGDIRDCGRANLRPVDVICGGFPCQDVSNAGLRAGMEGERSGLWSEMHRIIGELRPRFVVVENVAALLGRGIGRVLGDLAEIGYDAEWAIVSAADVGAPHLRERVWIVAYPASSNAGCWSEQFQGTKLTDWQSAQFLSDPSRGSGEAEAGNHNGKMADSASEQDWRLQQPEFLSNAGTGGEVAHADSERPQGRVFRDSRSECCAGGNAVSDRRFEAMADTGRAGREELHLAPVAIREGFDTRSTSERGGSSWWAVEPNVGRVADGIPARVDRLKALGNAVVPQIPEILAHRIREAMEAR